MPIEETNFCPFAADKTTATGDPATPMHSHLPPTWEDTDFRIINWSNGYEAWTRYATWKWDRLLWQYRAWDGDIGPADNVDFDWVRYWDSGLGDYGDPEQIGDGNFVWDADLYRWEGAAHPATAAVGGPGTLLYWVLWEDDDYIMGLYHPETRDTNDTYDDCPIEILNNTYAGWSYIAAPQGYLSARGIIALYPPPLSYSIFDGGKVHKRVGDTFWVTEYRHVRSYPVDRYTGESTVFPLADGEDETLYLYAPEDDPPPYGVRDEFVSTTAPGCTVHLRDHAGVASPTMLTPLGNPIIITGTVVIVEAGVEVGDPIPHKLYDPPTTITYWIAPAQTHLAPDEDAVVIEVRDPCEDEWGYCYARQWTRQNLSGTIQWDGMLDMYYEGELYEYNVKFCTASTVFATISVKVQDRYWTTFGGLEEPIVGPWTFEMPRIAIIEPEWESLFMVCDPAEMVLAASPAVHTPVSEAHWSGGEDPTTGTGATFMTTFRLRLGQQAIEATLFD